uniref:Cytochrome b561 domain-containing protein n=1 Tax=Philodina roseola TaxID=96448 RepID=B6S344_PHIRO|nr:hypothetical protein [Philodina roseola]
MLLIVGKSRRQHICLQSTERQSLTRLNKYSNRFQMGSGRYDEMGSTRVSWRWFFMMICSAQMIGVIAIILLAVVLGQYRGGFTWTNSEKELNYHPLFMSLGMIFFYGDAILAYRVFRDVKKIRVKILHASLLALSFIFSSIGLKAVFDNHNYADPPRDNLYSLHSWLGILTRRTSTKLHAEVKRRKTHSFRQNSFNDFFLHLVTNFGAKLFFSWPSLRFSWASLNITFCNKKIYDDPNKHPRNLMNIFGLFVVIFATIILYLVGNPGYQRPPENEVEHVPLSER